MKNPLKTSDSSFVMSVCFFAVLVMATSPLLASTPSFVVPNDIALRIRLDDTLTSVDSRVGDPFSGTVVDQGECQNARVYGHIAEIQMSGRVKGNTSMGLRFDRLVMPDGRRAPIHAEIIELYHAPSGEKVDVEGAIESGGRGRTSVEHTGDRSWRWCLAWWNLRWGRRGRDRVRHRRRGWSGYYCIPRTSEDHAQ